ncbi:hypothetical protein FACS189419_08320 [Planctomycetales bacterium]|nr:hypothetical protein FACS189419_08320 [Planctomycetales bacterium]
MSRFATVIVLFLISSAAVLAEYPVKPVPFTNVKIDDSFWSPRQKVNHEHSIPFAFEQCEKTGRLENFKLVAGKAKQGYKYTQPIFNDTDIYKGIEAASYDLAVNPDPKMEAYLDTLIAAVAEAQQPDGYLYTALTCGQEVKNSFGAKTSDGRWEDLQWSHELYNAGHLFEAATAHYAATGKRNFLDVAVKLADFLVKTFGGKEGQIQDVPGHEVVEMGLVKMHNATGNGDYLKLAKFFVDMRGRKDLRNSKSVKGPKTMYGAYAQDDIPLADHNEAVGHAVRAGYFYAGAADVAVLTGDTKTIDALHRIWDNVVTKKLSLNGGLGATPHGEAFDKNYVLPNEYRQTYNETCAQIAGCYWYQRMFLLDPDTKYYDVLERTIYNGLISGVSLSGDRFFYPNPQTSRGGYNRQAWFGCACCPQNLMRFVASLGGYIYAVKEDTLFVNLYIGNQAATDVAGQKVKVEMKSGLPDKGNVAITLHPEKTATWKLALRIPGWAVGKPVPSDLYSYLGNNSYSKPVVEVNGKQIEYNTDKGFAVIEREWKENDKVAIKIDTPLNRVGCNEQVAANRNRVAFEKGPLVYCFESIDNDGHLFDLIPESTDNAAAKTETNLGDAESLTIDGVLVKRQRDGSLDKEKRKLKMIPYCVWDNRGDTAMQVWMSTDETTVEARKPYQNAAVSVSFARPKDDMPNRKRFINDGKFPQGNETLNLQHFDWWEHLGTVEWVQYDFREPITVEHSAVYWFDDTGRGQCRVPKSWRILYKTGNDWKEVALTEGSAYRNEKGTLNAVDFAPITTNSLRLEVALPEGFSAGVFEWAVE